jgi:hypothetical protein
MTNKSPPAHSPPMVPGSAGPMGPGGPSSASQLQQATPPLSAPPSYATWERATSNNQQVPPPLASAPSLATPPAAGGPGTGVSGNKVPVKAMQQLHRQLSAGQSSVQSYSGRLDAAAVT